jgi:S-DNA-T family DNA segregation ATPase FtsK/SpoIIIE
VSDEEVEAVVKHLREQGEPQYIEQILTAPDDAPDEDAEERDVMYDQAVAVVAEAGKASTSLLQRRLKLGYNRAARIVDAMEAAGVVGPPDGARPREVFVRPFEL